eukprot:1609013-Alexandrium_andersonii.AAC.1
MRCHYISARLDGNAHGDQLRQYNHDSASPGLSVLPVLRLGVFELLDGSIAVAVMIRAWKRRRWQRQRSL